MVHICQRTDCDVTLVSKRVRAELSGAHERSAKERLEREARALAALHSSKCVVNVIHYQDDVLYTEYHVAMPIEFLRSRAHALDFDPNWGALGKAALEVYTAAYVYDCLRGLDDMHSNKMIHCDIKPSNYIWDGCTGHVIDLGGVEYLNCGSYGTKPTTTYPYAPPEVSMPDFDLLDNCKLWFAPSFDIWSVGVMMASLLLGQKPFGNPGSSEEHYHAIISRHHHVVPHIKRSYPTIGPLVAKMFDLDPTQRPTTAETLEEIQSIIDNGIQTMEQYCRGRLDIRIPAMLVQRCSSAQRMTARPDTPVQLTPSTNEYLSPTRGSICRIDVSYNLILKLHAINSLKSRRNIFFADSERLCIVCGKLLDPNGFSLTCTRRGPAFCLESPIKTCCGKLLTNSIYKAIKRGADQGCKTIWITATALRRLNSLDDVSI